MYDATPTMIERLARHRISERTAPAHPHARRAAELGAGARTSRRTALASALRRAADRLDA